MIRIVNQRTNHIENPLGYTLNIPSLSWQVEGAKGHRQTAGKVEVALDEGFEQIVFTAEGEQADSLATRVQAELLETTRYYWRVQLTTDAGEEAQSDIAWFETGKKTLDGMFLTAKIEEKQVEPCKTEDKGIEEDTAETTKQINGIETEKDTLEQPKKNEGTENQVSLEYEKKFTLQELPVKARAYVCGLGFYECYLQDKKIGEEYLAPGLNGYDSWIQVQTYDILPYLQQGENAFSALTGDGLYKGRFGFEGGRDKIYGERQCFACDIVLTYGDGRVEEISTDETWKIRASKVKFSNIYDGEVWDDTFESTEYFTVMEEPVDKTKLMPRLSLPVLEMEQRKPVEVIKTPAGETVLDMGQNMVGWLSFRNHLPKGHQVTFQFGEILQDGNFYNENLRVAKQEFTYISDGKKKEVRPHFTFYGFRYVKVNNWTGELSLEDFTGRVLYSGMKRTGFVETSNAKVNRLFSNVIWGQKGNFVDVPTDCPQRDERMGWTGDAEVFCGTAAFNMDIYPFMMKYCHDMKLEQRKQDGVTPMVVPSVGMQGGGCCAWADAATVIPWTVYEHSGDPGILEESYEGMKAWAEHIYKEDEKSGGHRLWTTGFHFGDWLAMDGEDPRFPTGGTEVYFICSCYYLMSTRIVADAAKVLGKKEEAESFGKRAEEIREAIRREYFTPNGRLALSNQTAYALALYCGLAEEEQVERLSDDFEKRMEKDNGYLKTGFVGTPLLCRELSDHGHNGMAYKLLLNEELPSWLYCVNMGATTIWERWNSVMPDGHMNPEGMNSLNHYSYGAIAEWMYRNMGGINETEPGFRKVRIAPMPDERIEWAKVSYASASGTIVSNWQYQEKEAGKELIYEIELPFGVSGNIEIGTAGAKKVTVNGEEYPVAELLVLPEAESGSFTICVSYPQKADKEEAV